MNQQYIYPRLNCSFLRQYYGVLTEVILIVFYLKPAAIDMTGIIDFQNNAYKPVKP
jgi:hypothetical protein